MTDALSCELLIGGVVCGGTADVRRYLAGWRDAQHRPAVMAGHPEPDPQGTRPEDRPRASPIEYGTATTDPLGRTIPGHNKNGYIPRLPCTLCTKTPRPLEHKGDHT